MNYQKIYDQLIEKRLKNPAKTNIPGAVEKHHIIPRSICPASKKTVALTVREHFVAHRLLVKIMKEKYGETSNQYDKMVSALLFFTTGIKSNDKRQAGRSSIKKHISSRLFEKIRIAFGKVSSRRMTGKLVGSKNGMYGKKHSLKSKQKMSKTRKQLKLSAGKNNPMYKRPLTTILSSEKIKLWHKHQSEKLKGKLNPAYGRKWMHLKGSTKKRDRVYVKQEDCEKYLKLGYVYGMKESKNV